MSCLLLGWVPAFARPARAAPTAAQTALWAGQARSVLDQALVVERGWVRIHAAEAWVALGEGERMRALLEPEASSREQAAFRIGIWRVLALTARTPGERAGWIARIEAAFLDSASSDRLQAIETLGKLGHRVEGRVLAATRTMLAEIPPADGLFPLWALVLAEEPGAASRLVRSLAAEEPGVRRRAAYVLRRLPPTPEIHRALVQAVEREPADTVAYPYLVSTALARVDRPAQAARWQAALEDALATKPANVRYEVCQTLMEHYTPADLPRWLPLLDHAEGDTRIGVAWMILHVLQRSP